MARVVEGDLFPRTPLACSRCGGPTSSDAAALDRSGRDLCSDCEGVPEPVCSYWQRQEFRHADDYGFGSSPYELMTPEQAEAHQAARDAEDEKDPPCGKCVACLEPSDGVPEPVAEEQTEKTSKVSNHCAHCGERYVTKRVGEGRVDVVCPRGCETGGAL